jgi:hypothetical protein
MDVDFGDLIYYLKTVSYLLTDTRYNVNHNFESQQYSSKNRIQDTDSSGGLVAYRIVF